ncbi:hypothetical protein DSCO28_70920 [Desulfosarcina ovata subsp. sediminis]|uniref:PEP-CTERM protein-sorting domain-containing protein n=1 Tax=Desulfosarcina ovata subsp. sediminis TaxID=885957 RepID=A0A5K8A254_9BACT|nr:hypothetical protein [Desulfosarcina ovata]BBO86526.1 hypothetical protein DSCO28_70920 [Desulfosarcina ovata subsp. sediminis]
MKSVRMLMAVLCVVFISTGAYAYTWDQIDLEATYGEGDNTALLVIDFSSASDDSFAWKINFSDTSISAIGLLNVVAANDSSFTVEGSGWVTQINYGCYSGTDSWWMNNVTYDLGETWPGYGAAADGQGIGWKSGEDANTYSPETPTSPVPIPGPVLLLGSGLFGLIGIRRKR